MDSVEQAMDEADVSIGETLWRLLDEARGTGLFPVTDITDKIAALRQEAKEGTHVWLFTQNDEPMSFSMNFFVGLL